MKIHGYVIEYGYGANSILNKNLAFFIFSPTDEKAREYCENYVKNNLTTAKSYDGNGYSYYDIKKADVKSLNGKSAIIVYIEEEKKE